MNLRFLLGFALFAVTAANAQSPPAHDAPAVVRYHYGMVLDIAKVERMSEPATLECVVIPAQMTYLDRSGREHTVQYLKLAEACDKQN